MRCCRDLPYWARSPVFGRLTRAHGVHTAGWILVLIAVGLAVLVRGLPRAPRH